MLTINVNYVKELLKNNKHVLEFDGDGGEFCIHTFGEAFCPITEALNHLDYLVEEIEELQAEVKFWKDSHYPTTRYAYE